MTNAIYYLSMMEYPKKITLLPEDFDVKCLNFKTIEKVPQHHMLNKKKKDSILKMDRLSQWKEICKQWKKYSFNNKVYLLNRI